MTFESGQAAIYTVTVPTRPAAELLADELASRGHRLVAVREVDHFAKVRGTPPMRPQEAGSWDVFSVVDGIAPDDDVRWWVAQEDLAVKRLAAVGGARTAISSGGGSADLLLQVFTRDGLVHELDADTARERRLPALAPCPPRAGAPEPTVRETPADADGDPVELPHLDDAEWAGLEHAYRPAGDVPDLLRTMAANDGRWEEAVGEVIGSVFHQGSLYSSSPPTVRVLAVLAASPALAPKRRLDLLYTLFLAGVSSSLAEAHGYRPESHAATTRDAVVDEAPRLLPLAPTVTREERRVLLVLAALAGLGMDLQVDDDPAARLAAATSRSDADGEHVLRDLATRHDELLQLADNDGPLRPRLLAAMHALLFA